MSQLNKLGGFDSPERQAGALSAMANVKNSLPPLMNQKWGRKYLNLATENSSEPRGFKKSGNRADYNDGKNIGWGVVEYPDPVMKPGQNQMAKPAVRSFDRKNTHQFIY